MTIAPSPLKGKSILVTGAATGIGRATAEHLGAAGACVFGIGLDTEAGIDLAGMAAEAGWQVTFREADVTRESDVRASIAALLATHGRIDGVVNCAGIYTQGKRVEDLSDDEWNRTLDVNLTAIFRVCRATLPEMRKGGGGSVVNIASVHALATVQDVPAYAASKGGVLAFSRQLALDYAIDSIRVNALIVGSVDTRMTRAGLDASGGAEQLGLSFDRNAIGRIANPSEIALTIAFLLSEDSSFITGSGLVADGGMTTKLF